MKTIISVCKSIFEKLIFMLSKCGGEKEDDDDWMDEHSTYGVESRRRNRRRSKRSP
jgi:hypothetical protein